MVQKRPTWLLNPNLFVISIATFSKKSTNPEFYKILSKSNTGNYYLPMAPTHHSLPLTTSVLQNMCLTHSKLPLNSPTYNLWIIQIVKLFGHMITSTNIYCFLKSLSLDLLTRILKFNTKCMIFVIVNKCDYALLLLILNLKCRPLPESNVH